MNLYVKKLKEQGVTHALVTNPINIYYVSGHKTDAVKDVKIGNMDDPVGVLFIDVNSNNMYFLVDSRYEGTEVPRDVELIVMPRESGEKFIDRVVLFLEQEKFSKNDRLGIEFKGLNYYDGTSIINKLIEKFGLNGKSIIDISETPVLIRETKTNREIELLRVATQKTDDIFQEAMNAVEPGKTESKIVNLIHELTLKAGCETSFPPIVAGGANSAIPHHSPGDYVFKEKDVVLIDLGACYKGYHGDMTRVIFLGEPTEEEKKVYNIVLESLQVATSVSKTGYSIKKLTQNSIDILAKYSYDKFFTHSLGHGIGLDIHESPKLSLKSEGELLENSVVTIEPGVYLQGKFGVRIEDAVLIKKDTCEVLTQTPKNIENFVK